MDRKSVAYVTKIFSNNAKHMQSLQTFYAITITFSSKSDRRLFEGSLKNQAFLTAPLLLSTSNFSVFSFFLGNWYAKIKAGAEL